MLAGDLNATADSTRHKKLHCGLLDYVYFFSPTTVTCDLFRINPVYYIDHDAVTFTLHLEDEIAGKIKCVYDLQLVLL